MTDIILASSSPRRQELLKQIDISYRVEKASCNESYEDGMGPGQVVLELSARKADNVFDKIISTGDVSKNIAVIGSDTVVSIDGKILGKPHDQKEAFAMLKTLSGKSHEVFTGVTIMYWINGRISTDSFAECTRVNFRDLSDDEINAYIATGEPMDKAGAYGIQEKGAVLVKGIEGDFYTVVGLPVAKVYESLKQNGVI